MLLRLLLRFVLVPLGGGIAIAVAVFTVCFAHWSEFARIIAADPDAPENVIVAVIVVGPSAAIAISVAAVTMLAPAAIGVLLAEGFALRSWIFHAANGALASWIGWLTMRDLMRPDQFYSDPTIVVGAGIAAGFTYWLIAGWSAGFWKPLRAPAPSHPKPA